MTIMLSNLTAPFRKGESIQLQLRRIVVSPISMVAGLVVLVVCLIYATAKQSDDNIAVIAQPTFSREYPVQRRLVIDIDILPASDLAKSFRTAGLRAEAASRLALIFTPARGRDGVAGHHQIQVMQVYFHHVPRHVPLASSGLELPDAVRFWIDDDMMTLYRFSDRGRDQYYGPDGIPASAPLVIDPVQNARLSSRFGARRHPILGIWHQHKGIDLAAAFGTEVVATGAGIVTKSGWGGGYGRHVRIRHDANHETLYAHLSEIAELHAGDGVFAGQIIGKVGNSGLTTGSHLHYELRVDGKEVDPLRHPATRPIALKGTRLARFMRFRLAIDDHLNLGVPERYRLADAQ